MLFTKQFQSWLSLREFAVRLLLITSGTLIGAASVVVFFVPGDIAPAGVTGLAVINNLQFGLPVGIQIFVLNIPILYLAYRMLGGFRAVIWALYVIVLYSFAIELMGPLFNDAGLSDDQLLNAIFAGIVGGIGSGLIYRGGGSFGGTSTLARILQEKYGMPLSSTMLYVNLIVVVVAGVFIGWESALLSVIALIIEGSASDYMLEGPSVIRTVTIITNKPQEVSQVVLHTMRRGVTSWEGKGMYTGQPRSLLFVTISRPQVGTLRQLVTEVDPAAFIVIGQGHTAFGGDFRRNVPPNEVS
jgi:uncharacterized membrane-anchored protein YitT (DUF2179 family)